VSLLQNRSRLRRVITDYFSAQVFHRRLVLSKYLRYFGFGYLGPLLGNDRRRFVPVLLSPLQRRFIRR
jgi:hypothetical protein